MVDEENLTPNEQLKRISDSLDHPKVKEFFNQIKEAEKTGKSQKKTEVQTFSNLEFKCPNCNTTITLTVKGEKPKQNIKNKKTKTT